MNSTKKMFLVAVMCVLAAAGISCIQKPVSQNDLRTATSNDGLRMRETPDMNGNKVGLIPYGETVTLLEETGETLTMYNRTGRWSKIKWQDKTGWVFGGFLAKKVSVSLEKFVGSYELKLYDIKHELVLNKDTFVIMLNYCEGFDRASGTYTIENDEVVLKVLARQSSGYAGADKNEYRLKILADGGLQSEETIGCGPNKGDIYRKTN